MKVAERNQAYTLIMKGHTLKEAAEAVGVSLSTVERWSSEAGWQYLKRKRMNSMIEECSYKMSQTLNVRTNLALDEFNQMFVEAVAERRLYLEGKISKRQLRYSTREMIHLGKACVDVQAGFLNGLDNYKKPPISG